MGFLQHNDSSKFLLMQEPWDHFLPMTVLVLTVLMLFLSGNMYVAVDFSSNVKYCVIIGH